MRDHREVILRPVVSEKSYALLADNVYTFIVAPEATKPEIRAAVEAIFDVSVVKVNTLRRKGKRRHNRRNNTWVGEPTRSAPWSLWPRATRSTCSRPDHGDSQTQAVQSRSPVPDRVGLLGDHPLAT